MGMQGGAGQMAGFAAARMTSSSGTGRSDAFARFIRTGWQTLVGTCSQSQRRTGTLLRTAFATQTELNARATIRVHPIKYRGKARPAGGAAVQTA